MNTVEKIVYDKIKNSPRTKAKVVKLYQALFFPFRRKEITEGDNIKRFKGFYVGFHDKSPFDSGGQYLAVHKWNASLRRIQKDDSIEVGYIDINNGNFYSVGNTLGWNWQMGSMLQWDNSRELHLLYNFYECGKLRSKSVCIRSKKFIEYDYPVVDNSRNHLLSYSFVRTEAEMAGYGIVKDYVENDFDELLLVEKSTNNVVCSFSHDFLFERYPHSVMPSGSCFFHHALFNPSGTRFFFLQRSVDRNGRRWSRIFTSDLNGKNLFLFPMEEMVSHITWLDDNTLIAYARSSDSVDGYYLLKDGEGIQDLALNEVLNSDGHPTIKNGMIVTDTYPDRFSNQYCYLYDLENAELKEVFRSYLLLDKRDDLQIDMHPRFNNDGSAISLDIAPNGLPETVIIKL